MLSEHDSDTAAAGDVVEVGKGCEMQWRSFFAVWLWQQPMSGLLYRGHSTTMWQVCGAALAHTAADTTNTWRPETPQPPHLQELLQRRVEVLLPQVVELDVAALELLALELVGQHDLHDLQGRGSSVERHQTNDTPEAMGTDQVTNMICMTCMEGEVLGCPHDAWPRASFATMLPTVCACGDGCPGC